MHRPAEKKDGDGMVLGACVEHRSNLAKHPGFGNRERHYWISVEIKWVVAATEAALLG